MRHALQLLPIVCRIRWQKCSRFGFFLIKVTRLVFPFGRIFCKARPCLHIFTRIQIEHHHLTEECFVLLFFVLQKLEQNFIPLNPVMCRLTVALCPVEIAELLEEIERVLIQTLDHRQCVDELAAVVVDFHHLLHVFELQHIVVRQPFRVQYLIWFALLIMTVIFLGMLIHERTAQHFQKSQL